MYKKLIILIAAMTLALPAMATKPKPPPQTPQEQNQGQGQGQGQLQGQSSVNKNANLNLNLNSAIAEAEAGAIADANNSLHNDIEVGGAEVATTLDTSNSLDNSYSNQIDFDSSPVLTLVPQGHTAGCQRTYGLQFGDSNSGAGIGWPFRDKDCDYDNEAADAFASGQMEIGWYWNCHKKSSYKPFKGKGISIEQARDSCFRKMVSMLVTIPPHQPAPPVEVNVETCYSEHPETHERIFKKCVSK